MNLFISSLHFEKSLVKISRSVLPFIALLALSLALITYVPSLSTWLPEAVEGKLPTSALSSQPSEGGGALLDVFGDSDEISDLLDEVESELGEEAVEEGSPRQD